MVPTQTTKPTSLHLCLLHYTTSVFYTSLHYTTQACGRQVWQEAFSPLTPRICRPRPAKVQTRALRAPNVWWFPLWPINKYHALYAIIPSDDGPQYDGRPQLTTGHRPPDWILLFTKFRRRPSFINQIRMFPDFSPWNAGVSSTIIKNLTKQHQLKMR